MMSWRPNMDTSRGPKQRRVSIGDIPFVRHNKTSLLRLQSSCTSKTVMEKLSSGRVGSQMSSYREPQYHSSRLSQSARSRPLSSRTSGYQSGFYGSSVEVDRYNDFGDRGSSTDYPSERYVYFDDTVSHCGRDTAIGTCTSMSVSQSQLLENISELLDDDPDNDDDPDGSDDDDDLDDIRENDFEKGGQSDSARGRMDSIAYSTAMAQLFGGSSAWSGIRHAQKQLIVTPGERDLLNDLLVKYPSNMPSETEKLPDKKKIRPSSASANLQTHYTFASGLFDYENLRPQTAAPGVASERAPQGQRPITHGGAIRQPTEKALEEEAEELAGVKRERRLTIGPTDGLAESKEAYRPSNNANVFFGDVLKNKIEEKINIDLLEDLKLAFEQADEDGSGQLDLDEFKDLIKTKLNIVGGKENQIDALFYKIDVSSDGEITWDEFCTYMQLEYAEKEDSYLRSKEVAFHIPAKVVNTPHRDSVLRIGSDGATFIVCSQDGITSFWSSNMQLRKTKTVVTAEQSSRQKPKWITDFTVMTQYNKFIVGTGDREIQFFELSSFDPYCQISGLETVPLKLDYTYLGDDECMVLYGDSQGCINIVVIQSAGECLRIWHKMPKVEGIASTSIENIAAGPNTRFVRWKVHGDWIQELKYYEDLRGVISCSNHANTALVIGSTLGSTHVEAQLKEIKDPNAVKDKVKQKAAYIYANTQRRLEADETVFKIYKGVKSFDYSMKKNILVTGGMDRIVRIWNPYVPTKPIMMLRGHNAPIFHLFIAEEEERIFSISTDKVIKVWDVTDQNALLTVRPKAHKIRGDLQSCHYSPAAKALCVSTDQLACLHLRLKPVLHADIVITHKEPIHACKYNVQFKQVITCSDGSTIKLWDFESGRPVFDFGEAHGTEAITCMDFDGTGRRLITGGRDGCLKVWNYNNGQCLRTLTKSDTEPEEVCDVVYVEMNKNRYIVSVGWDRSINIYSDGDEGSIHHVQNPLPRWSDDENNGHKEDILAIAQCPPNKIATSSYDGEVIVWNLVSGHIFCHLHPPDTTAENNNERKASWAGDLSVNSLLFLKTRAQNKEAASLVSSGPRGKIHIWNVFHGGSLMACFQAACTKDKSCMVTAMKVNSDDTRLFTADNLGFIKVWDIDGYCLTEKEPNPPPLIKEWRGHIENVTCIDLIEDSSMLLSSSLDHTVRLWTYDGRYVGTFGQPDDWDIYNPKTYQDPHVPYDVLKDPLSLPDHPVLAEKKNVYQVIHEDSRRNSKQENEQNITPDPIQLLAKQTYYVDDDTIANQLKEKPFNKGTGKRLRHEKLKPVRQDRGGPSEYQMLRCYDLEDTPSPNAPNIRANKLGEFDFFDD
ncbi:unnamed protein product [Owenia fusiformis]|uniref:EF-hand domain-containing protein n=1 Tax=Owenia fusiformis TaxID=6347 RepID=A0A8S4N9R3_OWEFU|nr:unnamed protein product [Owenia fusiformis]